MFTTIWKFAATLITATTVYAVPSPELVERAGSPAVANGDFSAPFRGSWYFEQLGAPITRPLHNGNYVMQIANVDCEDEQYAEAFGRLVNTVGGEAYTLSFDYLFTETTSNVDWDVSYFRTSGCDPCLVYLFDNIHFRRNVQGNRWYTWSGDFVKPTVFDTQNMTVEVDLNTCGYQGKTLLDNFSVVLK